MRQVKPIIAGKILLFLFGCLFIFHLLVLSEIIPYNIVWAGKISNRKEMILMESVSLLLLAIATLVVALRMGYLKLAIRPSITQIGIWALFALFTLNTLGNLTAENPIEKYGFGLLTLVIAFLLLRLTHCHINKKSCKKY